MRNCKDRYALHNAGIFVYFPIFLQPEGEDDLKKKQLMELAILNGTYRDAKAIPAMHPLHRKWVL